MRTDRRPTTDRPTFLDVNDHNFCCIQDRFVIFGSKIWFSGQPIQRGHLNLPPTALVAMETKFETKLAITQHV